MAPTRKTIDLQALERAAKGALARLPWWDGGAVPGRAFLESVARDLPSGIANGRPFQSALRAVTALSAARELQATAVRLIADPQVRQVAGDHMEWLLAHPDEALKQLAQHSLDHPRAYADGSPLRQALTALGEYETFHETYSNVESSGSASTEGSGGSSALAQQTTGTRIRSVSSSGAVGGGGRPRAPTVARTPGPGTAKEPSTYKELIAAEKLTPAQWARLNSLAAERHPEEDEPGAPVSDSYHGPTAESDNADQNS